MVTLTAEQRQLLHAASGEPPRLVDPDTSLEYVLVEARSYDRLRGALTETDPREFYPALHKALADEGWDDPQMDEYNRYG